MCNTVTPCPQGDKIRPSDRPLPDLPSNAQYIFHDNVCFDWGTFGWALSSTVLDVSSYTYIVFMNSSVRGPHLPVYWPVSLLVATCSHPALEDSYHAQCRDLQLVSAHNICAQRVAFASLVHLAWTSCVCCNSAEIVQQTMHGADQSSIAALAPPHTEGTGAAVSSPSHTNTSVCLCVSRRAH